MSAYSIPTVVETGPRGDRVTDIYSRLLSERIVFIGTPVDEGVANVVVAQLLHLAAAQPEVDIQLYLNSPGGAHAATMAIYDTMHLVAPAVATIGVGEVGSTSALLLAAGHPGKRSVLPHCRVRLQQPHAGGSRGSISDLAVEAAELARIRADGEALLSRHCGRPGDRVRLDTDRALVLNGAAAVEYGLVDQVLSGPDSGGEQLHRGAYAPLHP